MRHAAALHQQQDQAVDLVAGDAHLAGADADAHAARDVSTSGPCPACPAGPLPWSPRRALGARARRARRWSPVGARMRPGSCPSGQGARGWPRRQPRLDGCAPRSPGAAAAADAAALRPAARGRCANGLRPLLLRRLRQAARTGGPGAAAAGGVQLGRGRATRRRCGGRRRRCRRGLTAGGSCGSSVSRRVRGGIGGRRRGKLQALELRRIAGAGGGAAVRGPAPPTCQHGRRALLDAGPGGGKDILDRLAAPSLAGGLDSRRFAAVGATTAGSPWRRRGGWDGARRRRCRASRTAWSVPAHWLWHWPSAGRGWPPRRSCRAPSAGPPPGSCRRRRRPPARWRHRSGGGATAGLPARPPAARAATRGRARLGAVLGPHVLQQPAEVAGHVRAEANEIDVAGLQDGAASGSSVSASSRCSSVTARCACSRANPCARSRLSPRLDDIGNRFELVRKRLRHQQLPRHGVRAPEAYHMAALLNRRCRMLVQASSNSTR